MRATRVSRQKCHLHISISSQKGKERGEGETEAKRRGMKYWMRLEGWREGERKKGDEKTFEEMILVIVDFTSKDPLIYLRILLLPWRTVEICRQIAPVWIRVLYRGLVNYSSIDLSYKNSRNYYYFSQRTAGIRAFWEFFFISSKFHVNIFAMLTASSCNSFVWRQVNCKCRY